MDLLVGFFGDCEIFFEVDRVTEGLMSSLLSVDSSLPDGRKIGNFFGALIFFDEVWDFDFGAIDSFDFGSWILALVEELLLSNKADCKNMKNVSILRHKNTDDIEYL